jgi:copper chaperone NosL
MNATLTGKQKILVAVSAVILVAAYFVPIWRIDLEAPQFPEGLSMQIRINRLTGDVVTISNLNHYIGMKHISDDMFPEFGYLKYILGALIALGLAAAAIGRRWALWVWLVALLALSGLALYDMYAWGYDYGHNLDPKAAIKVEGMSYQPPLIGMKKLLNFTAYSYPDVGGVILFGSIVLAGVALWLSYRKTKAQ